MSRCATVALIGRPNAGKSTLSNAILGAHLSIVTPKPQTTRKRVLGIFTDDDTQLIFVDTPGILKPRYKLQHAMLGYVHESVDESDILCVVVDVVKAAERGTIDDPLIDTLLAKRQGTPTILVLNKMDALRDKQQALVLIEQARLSGRYTKAIAISASEKKYVDDLVSMLKEYAPEGPFVYDADELSTLPQRFFVAELIREAVFTLFREEVPYATDVTIVEFEERSEGKWYIAADIIVERDTQKAILIGAKGAALKTIGERARAAIEEHLEHPVYLELYVKVRSDWRNDRSQLAGLGY
ncbi:MAG TPA: GTPase Era [Bacteroidetes bacterium]|nr:GTPase Era [Bacteroidota bacterium]HRK03502.1 GTPase Era [Chlorobiota bacterium]